MEELVRPFQRPEKSQGFRPPSAQGTNPDVPETSFGPQGAGAPAEPYARTDAPQDWSWQPQLRQVLAGGQEIASAWREVSGSVVIDPNVCGIWLLNCRSAALAISFADLEPLPANAARTVFAGAGRVVTIEIVIQWQVAASGARSLSLSNVYFADGTAPDWTADAGMDVLAVQVFSNGLKLGKDIGLAMGVPS